MSFNSFNRLVFVMQKHCVSYEVGMEYLNIIHKKYCYIWHVIYTISKATAYMLGNLPYYFACPPAG
jgi:hypothetical protein